MWLVNVAKMPSSAKNRMAEPGLMWLLIIPVICERLQREGSCERRGEEKEGGPEA